jgi:hypothetical protein
MQKNQRGFGAIVAILILAVVGLVATGSWYVWKKNKDESSKIASSQETAPTTSGESEKAEDPTADWISYANKVGNYSFKYPKTWLVAPNLERCTEDTTLLAPDANSLGKCASSKGGQLQIHSEEGDKRESYVNAFSQSYYRDRETKDVLASDTPGTKTTTIVSGMEKEVFNGAYPDDTKVVLYMFFTKGRTYIAQYIQEPAYADVLEDFTLLVTKTFKFSTEQL